MIEEQIRQLIIDKHGSVRAFAHQIDIPYTTLRSILERGVMNASVDNVLKICAALGINPEDLASNTLNIPSIVFGENKGVNGTTNNGSITINNTQNDPVPVTVKNTDDLYGQIQEDKIIQKEILKTLKELSSDIQKININLKTIVDILDRTDDIYTTVQNNKKPEN